MELDKEIHRIESDAETDEISPRPYRLNTYDQLWERLVTKLEKLEQASFGESPEALMLEVGLLLAAGVERAINVATDRGVDVVNEESIETLTGDLNAKE